VGSDLQSDFRRQYAAIRRQETDNVTNIAQTYGDKIAKQYQSTSENLAALDAALLEYGKIRFADDPNWYDKMYSKSASGYELTEYGRQAFDKLLNEVGKDGLNFGGYLRKDPKNAKLADFYESNLGLTRELIAGLSADDMSYTTDDVYRAGAQEAYERAKAEAGDRLEEKEFDTFKEREEYYTEQAKIYNYQNRKNKDSNLLSNATYENIEIENVNGYKDVSKLTLDGTTYYIMDPKTLKESRMGDSRPTVVDSDVLRKLSNEKIADKYQEGDIFKYDGHTFIKQNGKLNVLSRELPETLKEKDPNAASKNAKKIGAGFLVEDGTGWGDRKFTLEDIGAGFAKPFFK
jgi:hypothetical protein